MQLNPTWMWVLGGTAALVGFVFSSLMGMLLFFLKRDLKRVDETIYRAQKAHTDVQAAHKRLREHENRLRRLEGLDNLSDSQD